MNRKKKIKTTLLAKKKKANAKLHKSNKPKYVSKAERARLAAESETTDNTIENSAVQEGEASEGKA
ncbi:MAG: DUF2986 domain-containing protein [Colwelliaceae bacterium]|nr:DUF2986 domain-containing protein [Colwelliaceae bacterium]